MNFLNFFLSFCNILDPNNEKMLWLPWFMMFERTVNKMNHPNLLCSKSNLFFTFLLCINDAFFGGRCKKQNVYMAIQDDMMYYICHNFWMFIKYVLLWRPPLHVLAYLWSCRLRILFFENQLDVPIWFSIVVLSRDYLLGYFESTNFRFF